MFAQFRYLFALIVFVFVLVPAAPNLLAAPNEVKITEVAPGVYFRKAQTEPVFTGCNQGWVIFKDFVLVIDANFPGQAAEVIATIRKYTDKPIKFVFDTHHHGDHADGNQQYTKIGATVIAHERSQLLFQTKGNEGFDRSKTTKAGEYGQLSYAIPALFFSHKLIFDDGDQRVELIFIGHGHTAGDAVAWLPKHNILFTGDACVNGAFNYTGDANTESWITVLTSMLELQPKMVFPGHGESGGMELINNQRRYFSELRTIVGRMIQEGKTWDQIKAQIELPFFKEWTGSEIKSRGENIERVHSELTAAKPPLRSSLEFQRWQKMPGAGQYSQHGVWEKIGESAADQRFGVLADMYISAGGIRRKELCDYFTGQTDTLREMSLYVRRMGLKIESTEDALWLRRALAIAAIEGGRGDYEETLRSLSLLRYGAERKGIAIDPFFRQIQNFIATENQPLFESARTKSATEIAATLRTYGPAGWQN